jgi:polysaccharide export outer membrane protein
MNNLNYKIPVRWFLLSLIIFQVGCRSHKDLTYLKDLEGQSITASRSITYYQHKIKSNDNLFVSIVSTNPELDEIYNPATAGNSRSFSGSNAWATAPGQFVFGYMVDIEGNITLPTFGKIHVVGLTIPDAEKEIETKAKQYLKDVAVKVRLLNYKVTVLGEVFNPGVYYNYNSVFTIFDAISMANGAKNTGALNNVLLIREKGNGIQTYKLNLNNSDLLTSQGFNILPNDVIVVQPAAFKNFELRLPIYTVVLSSITTFLLVLNFLQGK